MRRQPFPDFNILFEVMSEYDIDMADFHRILNSPTISFDEISLIDSMWMKYETLKKNNLSNKYSKDFETWWATYPVNDAHSHYGITRPLRLSEDKCRMLYYEAIASGNTPEALLRALKKEIHNRIISSITSNNLKFMKGSVAYLSEGHYNAWMTQEKNTISNVSAEDFKLDNNYGKNIL